MQIHYFYRTMLKAAINDITTTFSPRNFFANLALNTKKLLSCYKPKDFQDWLLLLVGGIGFVYTIIVLLHDDISMDEAHSYVYYSDPFNMRFWKPLLANNHPLNSFVSSFARLLFPYNDVVFRLPSLFWLLIYMGVALGIAKKFPKAKLAIFCCFILFMAFIPEYASQARGYCAATALTMLFIIRSWKTEQSHRRITNNLYVLFAAAYAFPGLIPLLLAVVVYVFFYVLKLKPWSYIKASYLAFPILLFLFGYIVYFLLEVSSGDKPLYGAYDKGLLYLSVWLVFWRTNRWL